MGHGYLKPWGVFSAVVSCLALRMNGSIKADSPSHLIWWSQLDFGWANAGAILIGSISYLPSCAFIV